ncbi:prolyl oligopeptidase family serine peptidase [Telmatobacter sp. DSM 110680]|uniref:Prolyl oligopeptidase family serine peptidase n=1 Tax=Telmatobacter sp. DSM 110680 TaxID=3036704 RepID=A0AAU7DK40_9BACT
MPRFPVPPRIGVFAVLLAAFNFGLCDSAVFAASAPTLEQILSYRYVNGLVSPEKGDCFAWVENVRGVRNIWFARSADTVPHQLTHFTADDGQELTQLKFSADGSQLFYVRGGDHDANWPAKGNLAPDPDGNPSEPKITIWSVATAGRSGSGQAPVKVIEGDSPALSSKGQIAYVNDGQIWTVQLPHGPDNAGKGQRLFFDRGKDDTPVWSPDGTHLAFVSRRDDHSFIGVFTLSGGPLVYLSPSTNKDEEPVWSPDGRSIAFVRQPSSGDAPENFLDLKPHPFALWTADASSGEGREVWRSPDTLAGSLPDLGEDEPLFWMADNHLVFMAELDNWPHLYEVDTKGAEARLLTPGNFMVENIAMSPDRRALVYSANTGKTADDDDRRHLFRVRTDGAAAETLTSGADLEWSPIALADDKVAYIGAGAQRPATVGVLAQAGQSQVLDTGSEKDYQTSALIVPKLVSFQSPDGLTIQGQLFRDPNATSRQPGVIFVHGGPPRQMLLGWHYMDYYSNAYAVNQYLAMHGFTVLSVNYRLGIGYGRAFQHPEHAGPAGAAEYQDVLAGARYLQKLDGVDAAHIGIWGGSYGGYLTGLALARNSDVFKAGVDFHGLSNWVLTLPKDGAVPAEWYAADDAWKKAVATAFAASPDADIATWKSPVLLIQGDDDRNVPFDQTVELAHRLEQQKTPFEELVIPNEIHGFLRWANWLRADEATVQFLSRHLLAQPAP